MFLLRLLVISVQFQLYFSTGCCTNSVSSFISEYLKIYFHISSKGCPPHSVSSLSQARLSFQSSFLFFLRLICLPIQFQFPFFQWLSYQSSFNFLFRIFFTTKSVSFLFFDSLSYEFIFIFLF